MTKEKNPEKDTQVFKEFANQGLNCKQIAEKMGINTKAFGYKMFNLLGVYPSVYIARLKRGKT